MSENTGVTETINISKKKYDELIEDQKLLSALIACGVDNWDGYDHAQDMIGDED